jgi:hypothetical protein
VNTGGQFRIDTVLIRSFRLYRAGFVPFTAVTLLAALPNLLVLLPSAAPAMGGASKSLIAIASDLYLNTIAQTVILFGALQRLRGDRLRLSEALHNTLARIFPLLGCATLYWLGLMGGLVLLVVPGIFCGIMWSVALAACALEGLGPIDSLRRSARLTAGRRWKVFAIVALLFVISIGVDQFMALVVLPDDALAKASGGMIWGAVSGAYWNCAFAMIYLELRASDPTDDGQIAAIFD